MKKIILAVLLSLASFMAFAGDWQSTIGTGISFTDEELNQKFKLFDNAYYLDLGGFWQADIDYDLTYLLVNKEFGLSFKADAGIGLAIMESILSESGYDKGFHLSGDIGVGYSFLRSDRATLGLFAVFGMNYATYKTSAEGSLSLPNGTEEKLTWDLETSLMHYSVGADLTGVFRFTKHLGLFGSFGARWVMGGKIKVSSTAKLAGLSESANLSWDINGKYLLTPKLGISWTF